MELLKKITRNCHVQNLYTNNTSSSEDSTITNSTRTCICQLESKSCSEKFPPCIFVYMSEKLLVHVVSVGKWTEVFWDSTNFPTRKQPWKRSTLIISTKRGACQETSVNIVQMLINAFIFFHLAIIYKWYRCCVKGSIWKSHRYGKAEMLFQPPRRGIGVLNILLLFLCPQRSSVSCNWLIFCGCFVHVSIQRVRTKNVAS